MPPRRAPAPAPASDRTSRSAAARSPSGGKQPVLAEPVAAELHERKDQPASERRQSMDGILRENPSPSINISRPDELYSRLPPRKQFGKDIAAEASKSGLDQVEEENEVKEEKGPAGAPSAALAADARLSPEREGADGHTRCSARAS